MHKGYIDIICIDTFLYCVSNIIYPSLHTTSSNFRKDPFRRNIMYFNIDVVLSFPYSFGLIFCVLCLVKFHSVYPPMFSTSFMV
jgi:hypothetical protein